MNGTLIDPLHHSQLDVARVALLELAVMVRILLRPHRDPASRIAWVLVVGVLPLLGMVAYLLLGEVNIGRRRVLTSTSNTDIAERRAGDLLIPLIRAAATIGIAIAPCSLGFVIIAVSEHLICSIMVGDDPELLMSDLQNQFPYDVIEFIENDDPGLVAKVVDSIERPDRALKLPVDVLGPNGTRKREICVGI